MNGRKLLPWVLMLVPFGPALLAQEKDPGIRKHSARVYAVFVDDATKPVEGVEVLSRIYPGAEIPARSGPDGRFEVVLEWDARMESTWYELYARRAGLALEKRRADLRAGQELDLGRVTLHPGGIVSGHVFDMQGKALAGARINIVKAGEERPAVDSRSEDGPEDVADHGGADAQGHYELVGVPPGRWRVHAKHESTWWRTGPVVEVTAGSVAIVPELRLEPLPEEYRIEGTVLDPQGKPFRGAKVTTSVRSAKSRYTLQSKTHTDESGRFVLFLARRAGGPVLLRVDPEDPVFDKVEVRQVQPGTRDIVARLGATRLAHVRVVDERSVPIERFGWRLSVRREVGLESSGEGTLDHPGGLATVRVPDLPFELEVESDDHKAETLGPFESGPLPELVEVRLTPLATISGTVAFEGHVVSGAFVELVQRELNHLEGVVEGHWSGLYNGLKGDPMRSADSAGRFSIPNDFPHLTYYVRAWREGYAEGLAGPVKVGESGVRVELGAGGSIEGVVDAGRPPVARRVALEIYREEFRPNSLHSTIGKVFRFESGANGRYRVDHLAPGAWQLRVLPSGTLVSDLGWTDGDARAAGLPYVIQIQESRTVSQDIHLGLDETCHLAGRILVGNLIREGYCKLLLEGPHALELGFASVDAEGRFDLAARSPGTYRLVIHAGPGHHQSKIITDLVKLVAGANAWQRDLPVSEWAGKGLRLDGR